MIKTEGIKKKANTKLIFISLALLCCLLTSSCSKQPLSEQSLSGQKLPSEKQKEKRAKKKISKENPTHLLPLDKIFDGKKVRKTNKSLPLTNLKEDDAIQYFSAWCDYLSRQYNSAEEKLKKLTQDVPAFIPAKELLLRIYLERAQLDKAEELAAKILSYQPYQPYANFAIARIEEEKLTRQGKEDITTKIAYRLYMAYQGYLKYPKKPAEFFLTAAKLANILNQKGYIRASFEIYKTLISELEKLEDQLKMVEDTRIRNIYRVYLPLYYLIASQFAIKLEDYPQARKYLLKAKEAKTTEKQAMASLIELAIIEGKREEALRILSKYQEKYPADKNLILFYKKLYPQDWQDRFVEGYNPHQEDIPFGINLAKTLIESNNTLLAQKILQKILEADPNNQEAFITLTLSAKDSPEAIQELATILTDTFSRIKALNILSFNQRYSIPQQRIHQLAEAFSKKHFEDIQKEAARLYLLGLANTLLSNYTDAIELYKNSLKTDPSYLPSYSALNWLLYYTRNWQELYNLTEAAEKNGIKTADIYYFKAVSLYEQGRLDDALRNALIADRINSRSDRIKLLICKINIARQDIKSSLDTFKEIISGYIIGPQTIDQVVNIAYSISRNNTLLIGYLLKKYKDTYGDDDIYKTLYAEYEYNQDYNVEKYRERLNRIIGNHYPCKLAILKKVKLEYMLKNYPALLSAAKSLLDDNKNLIEPAHFKVLSSLAAEAALRLLDYSEAERRYKELIRSWPHEWQFKLGLANLYYVSYQAEKLLPLTEKLLEEKDLSEYGDQIRWMNIASLIILKDYKRAKEKAEKYMKEKESDKLQWIKAYCLASLKGSGIENTIQVLDLYCKEYPQLKRDLTNYKISLLLKEGRLKEAKEVIDSLPKEEITRLLFLTEYLILEKNYADAIKVLKDTLENKSITIPADKVFPIKREYVRALIINEQYKEAEEFIKEQIKKDPEASTSWRQLLISLYFVKEEYNKADEILNSILREAPETSWANNSLGYSLLNRVPLAEIPPEKAFPDKTDKEKTDNENIDNERPYTEEEKEILKRAERLIRKAIIADPGNPAYLDSLGWAMFKEGKLKEAERFLTISYKGMQLAESEDPVLLEHLADLYVRLGKPYVAEKFYKKSIEIAKKMPKIDLEPNMPMRTEIKLNRLQKYLEKLRKTQKAKETDNTETQEKKRTKTEKEGIEKQHNKNENTTTHPQPYTR